MKPSTPGTGLLDRVVTLLHACEEGPATLNELVIRTGLARATAHRLATAMTEHGLLAKDDGRWSIGQTITRLAAPSGPPLAVTARPVLERLRDDTGESVQLFVRRGDERVCVVSLESPHSLRTIVPVGAVLPLDRGSAGRVLRDGADFAESVEEREAGVASVSAAIKDGAAEVVAAVSVSGPVERTTRQPGRRYGARVRAAAAAIQRASTPL
jgi:DNA-binding IclR family transcriptional regulator